MSKNGILTACARCKKLFVKTRLAVCPDCRQAEEEDFERIRDALNENPGATIEELAEIAGVSVMCISRMVESGAAQMEANKEAGVPVCGVCGSVGISHAKKICEACLQKLDAAVATEMARIQSDKLPQIRANKQGRMHAVDDVMRRRGRGHDR